MNLKVNINIKLIPSDLSEILVTYIENGEYTLEALKQTILDYLDCISLEEFSIDEESLNKLISEIKNYMNNLFNFDDCN